MHWTEQRDVDRQDATPAILEGDRDEDRVWEEMEEQEEEEGGEQEQEQEQEELTQGKDELEEENPVEDE